MPFARFRRYAVNTLIAAVLAIVVIDTCPQSPLALRLAMTPLAVRLGIDQGPWNLYAPDPDHVNTRLKVEITYRDGERRTWLEPAWPRLSPWDKWLNHRHIEWCESMASQGGAPAWEPWCRHLARSERPEFDHADQDAEARVIYHEAAIPPADNRPWRSIREPVRFDEGWVLTIEKLP
jgi:hypothetical protein